MPLKYVNTIYIKAPNLLYDCSLKYSCFDYHLCVSHILLMYKPIYMGGGVQTTILETIGTIAKYCTSEIIIEKTIYMKTEILHQYRRRRKKKQKLT